MSAEDFLYSGEVVAPGEERWISFGVAPPPDAREGSRLCERADWMPECWAQQQGHAECGARCQFAPPEYAPPPALEQHRPMTPHRYPAPKVSRQPDTEWTIGDALTWLDPKPPRRTLSRWLKVMQPVGYRCLPQGGPPAATYYARQIMQRHAKWAKNHGGTPGG